MAAGSETLIRQDAIKYLISRQGRRLTILTPTTYDSATYKCEAAFDRGGAPGPTYASAIHSANLTVQGKHVNIVSEVKEKNFQIRFHHVLMKTIVNFGHNVVIVKRFVFHTVNLKFSIGKWVDIIVLNLIF